MTAVQDINFFSYTLNMCMEMKVIMPQNKSNNRKSEQQPQDYRILYLLHGMTDDHTMWMRRSKIEQYVRDKNMIVVMPNVHLSWYTNTQYAGRYWDFISQELIDICHDLLPHISRKREDHIVAGLSMGGYGAIKLAFKRADYFAYGASLSGVLDIVSNLKVKRENQQLVTTESMEKAKYWKGIFGEINDRSPDDILELVKEDTAKNNSYYFISCGLQDTLLNHSLTFERMCRAKSYQITTDYTNGKHDWVYWDTQIVKVLEWYESKEDRLHGTS